MGMVSFDIRVSTYRAKRIKVLLVILLCLAQSGCITGYQKTDFHNNLSEDEIAKRREQFNAFMEGLRVFMQEERVLILVNELMKKQIVTIEKEEIAAQGMQSVTWHGNFYLYSDLPKDFSLTFNNGKLVTWNY